MVMEMSYKRRMTALIRALWRHPRWLTAALVLILFGLVWAPARTPTTLYLSVGSERGETSADFVGVAIDAAMLTGGDWWTDLDGPPRPLDMTDADLLRWSRILAPAWVRLGGTEADKLWWLSPEDTAAINPWLDRDDLTGFLSFTRAIGARPMITTSTGPRVREDGEWQPDQLQRLLDWLPETYNGVLEFGNEPGAHWLMFGLSHQFGFDQYTEEFAQARLLTGPIPLAGPANAFWPEIGEPLRPLVGSSRTFLENGANPAIFSWHYYPTQSSRCRVRTEGAEWESLVDIEAVAEFSRQASRVRDWVDRYSPDSELWLGETGPAQCGGVDQLTNRFGSSLWWLTQLGTAARTGQDKVIRQSLVGGDYALLAHRTRYSPNPDYWAQVLWSRLMGPRWFAVRGSGPVIQAYAHCDPTIPGILTLLTVNLTPVPITLMLPDNRPRPTLTVTSPALDSRYVQVEGQWPETFDWQAASPLPWKLHENLEPQPGHSYRFTRLEAPGQCD
jgi:heparanase 1